MSFKVGVGKSDFEALRKSDDYYVDKTDILYELVEEKDNQVTLFTRPRRFGKTLMMSMMSNFFSITKDGRAIFEGLKITEYKKFCGKWMNQYPVLFLSFKDVGAENFEGAYDMLEARLSEVCIEQAALKSDSKVNRNDVATFERLEAQKGTRVERTDFDVTEKFEALLNGGTVTQSISDELTYGMLQTSEDNLWSVLLMTGYLTKADAEEEGERVSLKIPNKEIASIFQDTVVAYFQNTVDASEIVSLIHALWESDETEATRLISALLWYTISYNDYHEDYYHAFLAGIFVGQGYHVESNKEKGLGRPDILIKDRRNRRAIIIEAKKSKKESDMDRDCDKAISQIIDERYSEGLYGYTQILCYGVAFFQKQAKVKKWAESYWPDGRKGNDNAEQGE
jgi:hypothetical protein